MHNAKKELAVSVIVEDPLKNIIYTKRHSIEGIIVFDSTVPGEYSFAIAPDSPGTAISATTKRTVTLALHTDEEKSEPRRFDFDDAGNRIELDDEDENMEGVLQEIDMQDFKGTLRDLRTSLSRV